METNDTTNSASGNTSPNPAMPTSAAGSNYTAGHRAGLGQNLKSSLRVGLIIVLAFASLIPLLIVDDIANERQRYFYQAQSEVANSWGRPQQLIGPVLIVPIDYAEPRDPLGWKSETPNVERLRRHLVLLPDDLEVQANIDHEMRERSIYEVALFSVDLSVNGSFRDPRGRVEEHLASLPKREHTVDWEGVRLVVGISDPRAIRLHLGAQNTTADEHPLQWRGTGVELVPSEYEAIAGNAIQAKVALPASTKDAAFNLRLGLGTTELFAVSALGKTTNYSMASSWAHPSFSGDHSPVTRQIDATGFSAQWEVHGLARSLPDAWIHEDQNRSLAHQQMTVAFYNPVTAYTNIDRGIKYGLLFIALTFLTYFCVELIAGLSFHVVQYAVVSIGLVMFYMTLLAASEHLTFSVSYLLATLLISGLLSAYTWSITHLRRITALIGVVLLGLYGTLFVLLQLEDFALLVGTMLLLLGLGALMFATRNLHRVSE